MSNPLQKIEHVTETVAKDIAHGVAEVFKVSDAVVKILATATKLTPAFKSELATLISDAEPIAQHWLQPSPPVVRM